MKLRMAKFMLILIKIPAAKEMLAEIVRVQIDDDITKGEKYVMDNFVWTDEMQLIGEKLQKVSKELNGRLETNWLINFYPKIK